MVVLYMILTFWVILFLITSHFGIVNGSKYGVAITEFCLLMIFICLFVMKAFNL